MPSPGDQQPVAGTDEEGRGADVRPEPGSPATATATTPVPKEMRTKVPRNSARHSPHSPPRRLRREGLTRGGISTAISAPQRTVRHNRRHSPASGGPASLPRSSPRRKALVAAPRHCPVCAPSRAEATRPALSMRMGCPPHSRHTPWESGEGSLTPPRSGPPRAHPRRRGHAGSRRSVPRRIRSSDTNEYDSWTGDSSIPSHPPGRAGTRPGGPASMVALCPARPAGMRNRPNARVGFRGAAGAAG